jgi:exopolysaccharide production protein ExoZ
MSNGDAPVQERASLLGIQYLRGIAALMVVFHHAINYITAYTWTGIGATGVDIFFVISGFIMAYTCSREMRAGESRALACADFLLKRLVRVVPLYWLAMIISWRAELLHGVLSLDMAKDFLFIPRYFAPNISRIWPKLIPGWTINCEMFFYLIFGLSILLSRHRLQLTLFALCALSIAGIFIRPSSAPAQLYTWSVFLEFGLGIVLYLVHRRWPLHLPTAIRLVVLGAAVGALAYAGRDNLYEYSSSRFLLYGMPAFFIVWIGLQVRQSSDMPLLKLLGDASYSIYLFHATIGIRVAIHVLAMLHMPSSNWFFAAVVLAILMAISAAIGVAIHWFVERPALGRLRRWSERQLFKRAARAVPSIC